VRLEGADLRLGSVALDQSGPPSSHRKGRLKLGTPREGPLTELDVEGVALAGPNEDLWAALARASVSGQADLQLLQAFARGMETAGRVSSGFPRRPLAALRTDGEIRLAPAPPASCDAGPLDGLSARCAGAPAGSVEACREA
jgi:hypothetical protein